MLDVHSVQMTNPKGTWKPSRKKKGKDKKGGGNDNNNVNKEEPSFVGGKKEERKVNFPCELCKEDHLTHEFPKMEESQILLA
jgi:hypothetical protein